MAVAPSSLGPQESTHRAQSDDCKSLLSLLSSWNHIVTYSCIALLMVSFLSRMLLFCVNLNPYSAMSGLGSRFGSNRPELVKFDSLTCRKSVWSSRMCPCAVASLKNLRPSTVWARVFKSPTLEDSGTDRLSQRPLGRTTRT